jgi:hypothetical protein
MGRFLILAAWATLLLLAGCGKSDLGRSCTLLAPTADGGTAPYDPPSEANDYISMGGADCEDFTCIDSAGDGAGAYCSRRCAEDAQCKGGEDDTLVCRELVLDEAFIQVLRDRLGEEEFFRVFGEIQNARYCAHPVGQ